MWSCVEARRIAVDRLRQELQRDRLAELEVVGAVDLAHAALAEEADDAIALVEDRARLEPSMIDVGRRPRPAAARGDRLRIGAARAAARRRAREIRSIGPSAILRLVAVRGAIRQPRHVGVSRREPRLVVIPWQGSLARGTGVPGVVGERPARGAPEGSHAGIVREAGGARREVRGDRCPTRPSGHCEP